MKNNLELLKAFGYEDMDELFVELEQKSNEMLALGYTRRREAFRYFLKDKKRDPMIDPEYLTSIENLRLCEIIKDLCYQLAKKKVERNLNNIISFSTTISFIVANIEKNISYEKFIEDIIKNRALVDLGWELMGIFHRIKSIMTFDPKDLEVID